MTDDPHPVYTIQQTAKRYKAIQLAGWVVVLAAVGLFMLILVWEVADLKGAAVIVAVPFAMGFILAVVGRLLQWWHHE